MRHGETRWKGNMTNECHSFNIYFLKLHKIILCETPTHKEASDKTQLDVRSKTLRQLVCKIYIYFFPAVFSACGCQVIDRKRGGVLNTFCTLWQKKLTVNGDKTESLTNPKWSCHVCCEELSHAPSSRCTTRKSCGSSWREENKPRYLQRTPARTRGKETRGTLALRKTFFTSGHNFRTLSLHLRV